MDTPERYVIFMPHPWTSTSTSVWETSLWDVVGICHGRVGVRWECTDGQWWGAERRSRDGAGMSILEIWVVWWDEFDDWILGSLVLLLLRQFSFVLVSATGLSFCCCRLTMGVSSTLDPFIPASYPGYCAFAHCLGSGSPFCMSDFYGGFSELRFIESTRALICWSKFAVAQWCLLESEMS